MISYAQWARHWTNQVPQKGRGTGQKPTRRSQTETQRFPPMKNESGVDRTMGRPLEGSNTAAGTEDKETRAVQVGFCLKIGLSSKTSILNHLNFYEMHQEDYHVKVLITVR